MITFLFLSKNELIIRRSWPPFREPSGNWQVWACPVIHSFIRYLCCSGSKFQTCRRPCKAGHRVITTYEKTRINLCLKSLILRRCENKDNIIANVLDTSSGYGQLFTDLCRISFDFIWKKSNTLRVNDSPLGSLFCKLFLFYIVYFVRTYFSRRRTRLLLRFLSLVPNRLADLVGSYDNV